MGNSSKESIAMINARAQQKPETLAEACLDSQESNRASFFCQLIVCSEEQLNAVHYIRRETPIGRQFYLISDAAVLGFGLV